MNVKIFSILNIILILVVIGLIAYSGLFLIIQYKAIADSNASKLEVTQFNLNEAENLKLLNKS